MRKKVIRKKRIVLLSVLLAALFTVNVTAASSTCPTCALNNVTTTTIQHSKNLWNQTVQHTVYYSDENKVQQSEVCTKTLMEDKIEWECPYHGVVSSTTHFQEIHTSKHCTGQDYYH